MEVLITSTNGETPKPKGFKIISSTTVYESSCKRITFVIELHTMNDLKTFVEKNHHEVLISKCRDHKHDGFTPELEVQIVNDYLD